MRGVLVTVAAAIVFIMAGTQYADAGQGKSRSTSDAQIKKTLIAESIAQYPGNCPCPYNSASNGSSCGRRSAYSRRGGYAPLCYDKDITRDMIREWRENHTSH